MPQTLDPTFYRSPAEAIAAPPEQLAYVAAYDPAGQARDLSYEPPQAMDRGRLGRRTKT